MSSPRSFLPAGPRILPLLALAVLFSDAPPTLSQASCDGTHDTTTATGNRLNDAYVCAADAAAAGAAASRHSAVDAQKTDFGQIDCAGLPCVDPRKCNYRARSAKEGMWTCVAAPAHLCDSGLSGWVCDGSVASVTCSCGPEKKKSCHGPKDVPLGFGSATFSVAVCGTDLASAVAAAKTSPATVAGTRAAGDVFCETFPCPGDKTCGRTKSESEKVDIEFCIPSLMPTLQCGPNTREFTCQVRLLSLHCSCN